MSQPRQKGELHYIFFDNILYNNNREDLIKSNIKDQVLNLLQHGHFKRGQHELVLSKVGDDYKGNNGIKIPYHFCSKPGDSVMNPWYIFDSINSRDYVVLMSYYTLEDIHSILTFKIEKRRTEYGVYIDALCVNNVENYSGAKILFESLINNTLPLIKDIEYIRLASVNSQNTLNFYKKQNLVQTHNMPNGLIEHEKRIVHSLTDTHVDDILDSLLADPNIGSYDFNSENNSTSSSIVPVEAPRQPPTISKYQAARKVAFATPTMSKYQRQRAATRAASKVASPSTPRMSKYQAYKALNAARTNTPVEQPVEQPVFRKKAQLPLPQAKPNIIINQNEYEVGVENNVSSSSTSQPQVDIIIRRKLTSTHKPDFLYGSEYNKAITSLSRKRYIPKSIGKTHISNSIGKTKKRKFNETGGKRKFKTRKV